MNDTQLHLRVLRVIQGHQKADPITGHALAEMFGTSVRGIQSVVEQLVDAGHKIGSSMSKPMGYFLATQPEELIETAEILRTRAMKYLTRRNKLMDFGRSAPTIWEQPQEAA